MNGRKFDEIKNRRRNISQSINEIEYLSSLVKLKKLGSLYSTICPFHHEHTPSLRVYPSGYKNPDGEVQDYTSWYCFGCKKGGDVVKFEQLFYDLPNVESACSSLESKFGLTYDEDNELNMLQRQLEQIQKPPVVAEYSLLELNFICSTLCRNYLMEIYHNYNEMFDAEFQFIQMVYKQLDYELAEHSAIELQNLVQRIQDCLIKRKNFLIN